MQDILLDPAGDLLLSPGMVRGESTDQHQALLLKANPGDFRESPMVGVGLFGWLKDEDDNGLLAAIKSQFEADGMTVTNISLVDQKLQINASYPPSSNAT